MKTIVKSALIGATAIAAVIGVTATLTAGNASYAGTTLTIGTATAINVLDDGAKLTTAASLWTVAAIGLAVGGGMYVAAVAGTFIVLLILAGMKPLERRFFADKQKRGVKFLVLADSFNMSHLPTLLGRSAACVSKFVVKRDQDERYDEVFIVFSRLSEREFQKVMQTFMQLEGVKSFDHTEV